LNLTYSINLNRKILNNTMGIGRKVSRHKELIYVSIFRLYLTHDKEFYPGLVGTDQAEKSISFHLYFS
jgi:hypothetical protein